jgi:DNA-binding MarR family transcriptional regulator
MFAIRAHPRNPRFSLALRSTIALFQHFNGGAKPSTFSLDTAPFCDYICIMQVIEEANPGLKDKAQDLRPLAIRLHRSLNEFVRQYQFRNRNEICCYGITVSGCYLLQVLNEKGPLSMQELATHLFLKISTVTRLVDGMAAKRLVRRRRDDRDKRVVRVELTEGGLRVLRKITEDLLSQEEELLASLSEDVREGVVDAISMLLQRIAPSGRSPSCEC